MSPRYARGVPPDVRELIQSNSIDVVVANGIQSVGFGVLYHASLREVSHSRVTEGDEDHRSRFDVYR
jgi:hypothetical protein